MWMFDREGAGGRPSSTAPVVDFKWSPDVDLSLIPGAEDVVAFLVRILQEKLEKFAGKVEEGRVVAKSGAEGGSSSAASAGSEQKGSSSAASARSSGKRVAKNGTGKNAVAVDDPKNAKDVAPDPKTDAPQLVRFGFGGGEKKKLKSLEEIDYEKTSRQRGGAAPPRVADSPKLLESGGGPSGETARVGRSFELEDASPPKEGKVRAFQLEDPSPKEFMTGGEQSDKGEGKRLDPEGVPIGKKRSIRQQRSIRGFQLEEPPDNFHPTGDDEEDPDERGAAGVLGEKKKKKRRKKKRGGTLFAGGFSSPFARSSDEEDSGSEMRSPIHLLFKREESANSLAVDDRGRKKRERLHDRSRSRRRASRVRRAEQERVEEDHSMEVERKPKKKKKKRRGSLDWDHEAEDHHDDFSDHEEQDAHAGAQDSRDEKEDEKPRKKKKKTSYVLEQSEVEQRESRGADEIPVYETIAERRERKAAKKNASKDSSKDLTKNRAGSSGQVASKASGSEGRFAETPSASPESSPVHLPERGSSTAQSHDNKEWRHGTHVAVAFTRGATSPAGTVAGGDLTGECSVILYRTKHRELLFNAGTSSGTPPPAEKAPAAPAETRCLPNTSSILIVGGLEAVISKGVLPNQVVLCWSAAALESWKNEFGKTRSGVAGRK